jgi:hypothetical protein
MPPPKKATRVHSKSSPQSEDSYYIPSENELNEPPENFDNYLRCIYGAKGAGKSTLASQFPNNLTLMFEPGRRNLRIRQLLIRKELAKDIIDGAPDPWGKLVNSTQQIIDDETISNITFDSVDIAYECHQHHICAKHGIDSPAKAGRSSADIWIEIRDSWAAYFDTLAQTRLSITFLSHKSVRESEQLDGIKMDRIEPSCAPACLKYIKQAVDFVFYYGTLNGVRCMQIRDATGMTEVAVGPQARFMQPNGKPIYYLEMPDLTDKESGYDRLVKAFNNECWDINTLEDERIISSVPKKGPPKKRPS